MFVFSAPPPTLSLAETALPAKIVNDAGGAFRQFSHGLQVGRVSRPAARVDKSYELERLLEVSRIR